MGVSLRNKPKVLLDANGNEIVDTQIYQAIDAFCCGQHGEYVVQRGTRLKGSSDQVRRSSTLWLPDAADDAEVALARWRFEPDFSSDE